MRAFVRGGEHPYSSFLFPPSLSRKSARRKRKRKSRPKKSLSSPPVNAQKSARGERQERRITFLLGQRKEALGEWKEKLCYMLSVAIKQYCRLVAYNRCFSKKEMCITCVKSVLFCRKRREVSYAHFSFDFSSSSSSSSDCLDGGKEEYFSQKNAPVIFYTVQF